MVDRNQLLYDPAMVEHYWDEYGSTYAILENVDTSVKYYELRTAIGYWISGQYPADDTYLNSRAIWERCEAFDSGQWRLNEDNEIVANNGN